MYTPPAHKIQLDTFDPLYIAQNLNAVPVLLWVVLLATQALQFWWYTDVVVGEPLQVKLPFLTAPGLCSVFSMFQILFSLFSCPPVYDTASWVHSLRPAFSSWCLICMNSVHSMLKAAQEQKSLGESPLPCQQAQTTAEAASPVDCVLVPQKQCHASLMQPL